MKLRKLFVASMALMALGASAQTAVTPASGTANPFAYALTSTAENGVINISYSLNTDAQAVAVIVKNKAGNEVINQALTGKTKGTHTATVNLEGQATDTYTWEIKVTGAAKSKMETFTDIRFYHPRGVDIDNNMESPAFGNIYVTEGMLSTSATYWSGTRGGNGLYIFKPDMTGVKNEVTGNYAFMGGYTASVPSYGSDLCRVRVAEDGRIFVTRCNQAGNYISYVKDAETLIKTNKFNSLLSGGSIDATTYEYKLSNGTFLAGGNLGFDIKGSGENLKLLALSINNKQWAFTSCSGSVVNEYNLGTATKLPTPTTITGVSNYTISPQATNVTYDNRGGVWYCQYRTTPSATQPCLIYVDATGTQKIFEGAGGAVRGGGGIRFNPDFSQIAIATSKTTFDIYNITYAEDNTPKLEGVYKVTHGIGTNVYDLAWDLANNIYICGNSGEHLKGFSIPRANNDFTTKAASKYAVNYEATPTITPVAGNANPFAYALSSTVENGVININYSLNTEATATEIIVKNSAGEVVITAEGETSKGAHTATVSLEGQETDTYTWEIKVTGAAQSEIKEFAAYRFYHPRGVDVDNNMESAAFGNIYVTEGIYTSNATYWSATRGGNGLYIFTPDMQGVPNGLTGMYAFMGGFIADERVATGSVTEGADLARVRVAEDGRIFVTRCNDSGSYIAYAQDAATLIAENKFNSLLGAGSLDASTYAFNDASGNFIAGPNLGFDIKGSGENLKMMALSAQQPLWVYSYKGSRIDEYALGNGTTLPAPIQHAALPQATTAPQTTNVEYDNRGGFWYCQMRQEPNNTNLALAYVDANGEVKFSEGLGGKYRGGAGIRMSPDYKQIAISSSTSTFTIYDIEYAADNTPTLTEKYIINHGIGRNLYDIAWDLAGNIYICGNSGEYLKGFSLPRENNEFTTTAASKYAVNYEAVAPLYIVGNSEEIAGWDPYNAVEFEFDGENYVFTLSEATTGFKISTNRGDWDEFCAGNLAVDAALTNGGTVNLSVDKDGRDIILPWAGVWTITVAGNLSTLTATTTTPAPAPEYPAAVYMVGHDNAWAPTTPLEITGENGVYTATVDFVNTIFKLSTTKGDWGEFNATGLNVASNPIAIGEPVALTAGYSNDIIIANTGKYDVTIDLVNNTLTLEAVVNYPEVIYAIGNINELNWSTSEGVAFTHKGDGVYEGSINVDNVDNGYGYFQFATTLGASWDAVNAGTRYGATETDLLVENGKIYDMTNNRGGGTLAWKCEAGVVEIEVDIANNTMKIVNLTGVEGIEVDNADVEYYNLQGVKVDNPTNGTYIKVQGKKTTKVYIK